MSATAPAISCDACHEVIHGKIVSALGKTWHPEHFKCDKCDKPIQGDTFNHHENKPWCQSCYTKHMLKSCHGCGKPITEKVIVAAGHHWHEEHFVCAACKKPLSGQSFFQKDGGNYCAKDYQDKFGSNCSGCKKPIVDSAIVALEGKWHQACFTCLNCKNPVTESTFHVRENRPLCTNCAK
ncbi:transforming growth factor beta-1-induced transcript 1 protein-like [Ctenocephalides felis]|uniref:transforming growth factor beta-1-induced transcript 1 protein-like n=1 Tax=Ctenocephalides felis TaxID=7515 RepID=UPI000E6E1B54|nr:transforming growth factor beta-1-induced transcript 1 protein-like [Ctenocephalides felis]XP_026477783.1 transforming growth factor beta-1-induced transcript 1 protein-like [Ctenocephalides felis]